MAYLSVILTTLSQHTRDVALALSTPQEDPAQLVEVTATTHMGNNGGATHPSADIATLGKRSSTVLLLDMLPHLPQRRCLQTMQD